MRLGFGEFIVDSDTRQLTRAGTFVSIAPKAFDLLMTLMAERPRVLSKEDLHSQLWPKTFVSDTSLATVVGELRAALGETARDARFIRTVHRHGYAFQGDAGELLARAPAADGVVSTDYWLVTPTRDIPLRPGGNIVGRDPRASVWLDAPSVSRQHARIDIADERVLLFDLESKNGTQVGATRVAGPTVLQDGDVVRFGSVSVTFRAWAAEPTRTEGGE